MNKPKYIYFHAHSRDRNVIVITDENDKTIFEHDGYTLDTPISSHNGNELQFKVDI